jgi:AmiR/NasT family two-component response regulator
VADSSLEPRNSPFLRDFAKLDVVVIAENDDDIAGLVKEVGRFRGSARRMWPPPELIPVQADILVCEYLPGLAERLPWLPGEAPMALVLLCRSDKTQDLKGLTDCAPHGLLWRPVVQGAVIPTLVMARSQALYEQRLRSRIEKLDDNLRTMRSVELAKAILMNVKNMTEEEAYHFLRRQAMERRMSIGTLASAIIDTKDLLG